MSSAAAVTGTLRVKLPYLVGYNMGVGSEGIPLPNDPKYVLCFFGHKTLSFPFQNHPKNLNLSFKTDLDFLGLFWKRKPHYKAELHKTDLHISENFRKVHSRLAGPHLTHEPEVPGSIPGPATYFHFSFH